MRIVSGSLKGRKITAPKNLPVRPTTDMAKEALFNILNNSFYFEDISVYERVSIVNELPLALNNNIIDYISGTKTVETESLTFDDGNVVEIDAGFLAAD